MKARSTTVRTTCLFCGALVVIERFADKRTQIDHCAPICQKFSDLCKASGGKETGVSVRDADTDELVPMSKGGAA